MRRFRTIGGYSRHDRLRDFCLCVCWTFCADNGVRQRLLADVTARRQRTLEFVKRTDSLCGTGVRAAHSAPPKTALPEMTHLSLRTQRTILLSPMLQARGAIHPLLLILLAAFFCIIAPTLTIGPAGGSSEAREMHVAQSILLNHDWILPLRSGLIPSKPPLYHWLVAITYSYGQSLWSIEFAARLISLASALLILLCTWQLAKRISLQIYSSEADAVHTAALSVAILMSSYGFFSMAGTAMVDMLYSACVVAAITCMILPLARSGGLDPLDALLRPRDFFLFYLCCGIGVLAKGPIAVVLPIVASAAVHTRLFGVSKAFRIWVAPRSGWIAFLALALPWYFMAATHGGDSFINRQLLFENVQRFLGGEHVNSQPWWFYLPSLLRTAAPWSLVWCCAVWWQLSGGRGIGPSLRAAPTTIRLAQSPIIWTLAGLLLFSLSAGKRHSYLLPLYPAIAITTAHCLIHWWHSRSDAFRLRVARFVGGTAPSAIAFVSLMLLCAISGDLLALQAGPSVRAFGEYLQKYQGPLVGALLIGGLLSYALWKSCRFSIWLSAFLPVFTIAVLSLQAGIGFKNELKDFDQIARSISLQLAGAASEPIGILRYRWEEYLDPVMFYLPGEETVIAPAAFATNPHDMPRFMIAPTWHDDIVGQSSLYEERSRFRQKGDMLRHRFDRDIVVWERRTVE